MKNSAPKKINDILQNSSLSRIVEKANFINDLNQKIQKRWPESYRGLYRIVNLVDNQLIVSVKNATVRQGLILQQNMLLKQIQTDLPEITQLEFRVNPSVT
ncbi:DciA family protein [Mannheimia haemolytica]|nr:DciA family protein [Mannheimia haemolytica]MDW0369297.1 DciA family protein [Mannheimia haemolytica]MDW0377045.1 DciA family protein [Mannheimia haemolytica]MDW0382340.1 DciA family protein [Mannheimia haemolytica]MDW0385085.1 DciA family protein [Mannheimia haemolytica]